MSYNSTDGFVHEACACPGEACDRFSNKPRREVFILFYRKVKVQLSHRVGPVDTALLHSIAMCRYNIYEPKN